VPSTSSSSTPYSPSPETLKVCGPFCANKGTAHL
jgi:hypothetical protein